MASGTITLTRTGSGYLTGQILWSSQSNGSEANTSTVTAKLQIQRSALNSTTGTFKGSFKVGSTSKTISWYGTLPTYEWVTIETVTATVDHNADGKGSCYLYALVNGPTQTTMEGTYVSGSATVTLDAIPRFAGIVSATDFTDEGDPTITYSNPAGNAVALLQACISLDGSAADIPYRDISKTGTKYTFSLTEAERNTLRAATPDSNTLQVKVFVRSKIGDTTKAVYTKSTMTVVNADPTLSATVVDINAATTELTGDNSILVALYSKAKVTISATPKKYATIKTKKVTHGTASLSGDGTLSVTNNPIKITVTDSRGNATTKTAANTVIPYINPTCTIGDQIPEADGSYALKVTGVFYNGAIGNTTNTLTVQYRYKAAGGSYNSWTTFKTVTKNKNKYTATANLTGFDYQTVYTVQARVIDKLHTGGVYAANKLVIAEPVFHWGKNDFQFNVPVNLKDGCEIRKNGTTAYVPTEIRTSEDVNAELTNGHFRVTSASANHPFTHGAGHVRSYNADEVVQNIVQTTSGNEVIRRTTDGGTTWTEEYVNPPMIAGTEYRTTERWNGKTVYTTGLVWSALPDAKASTGAFLPNGSNATEWVDSKVYLRNSAGNVSSCPLFDWANGTTIAANSRTTSEGVYIRNYSDLSGYTAYCIAKYTKD